MTQTHTSSVGTAPNDPAGGGAALSDAARNGAAQPSVLSLAGLPYFPIAFIARLPFAMMVVGVLTVAVSARGSLSLGGLTSAFVGVGTAVVGPLLGAAADRFGQRRVLLLIAPVNSVLLLVFCAVVYSQASPALLLLAAFGIGATAPQVAPMSRSRLVTLIAERMAPARRPKALSATMSYESAADEMVFVFGPFLVGILASALSPWAPLAIAAALSAVFVIAFALHPTGRAVSAARSEDGSAPSSARELFRPVLLTVVVGIFGVGLFFGSVLTSLTSFMADLGESERAGLFYGIMGIGSAVLALGMAWLPARFSLRARWLTFGLLLLGGSLLLANATALAAVVVALALMGTGVGPVLVTLYGLGADRSPLGRSATVMTMLGSGVIVGQSLAAAGTGQVAEALGTGTALWAPVCAASVVVLAGAANWFLTGHADTAEASATRASAARVSVAADE
ncbi:MFS transporter [Brevibacterium sp.]|uniref:MFS transporter n=1 Tax=Brevibacterium sp. TaxID=1701 RepID=UPI0025C0C2E4|nr:MFS transporter [Brevibacterium sp.]